MSLATIRPSRETYSRAIRPSIGLFIGLAVVIVIAFRDEILFGIAALVVAAGLSALQLWLYFRNTRVDYGPGRIVSRNLFGRAKEVAVGDIQTALAVLSLATTAVVAVPQLLLLDAGGRVLLRLRGVTWSSDQMGELLTVVPVTPVVLSEPISPLALRERYPLAIGWWESHRVLGAVIVGVGVFVVAIAAVAITLAIAFGQLNDSLQSR
jgi:hypothetical protein